MAATTTRSILEIAALTAGVCRRDQLLAAGIPARTIDHRLRSGFLISGGRGVYRLPQLEGDETPWYLATALHPGGVVSHVSAARLWGLPVPPAEPGEPVHVTVPRGRGVRRASTAVVIHAARRWDPTDRREWRPRLWATSPARTIVDLTGTTIGDRRLRHIVQSAVVSGQVALADVRSCLQRVGSRGVAGAGRLRRLLDQLDDGQPVAESELERRLDALLDGRFRRQYRPPWYDGVRGIVDFADPVGRLIVEADGRRWHTTAQAMADDRGRDRRAATNGWMVLRVAWIDVVDRPEAIAAEIAGVAAARGQRAA